MMRITNSYCVASTHFRAEEVPKEVLKCKAVAREIVFSSAEEVAGFRYYIHTMRVTYT
jgi:hypothetical protein